MDIVNSFPVFEADQVLTNNHLNDLRNYLSQQNRLTRCKLIGSGIVCGLEIKYSAASIKVSKGCALTSQGYLITTCDKEYSWQIPYTVPEFPKHLDLFQQCGKDEMPLPPFYNADFNHGLLQLLSQSEYDNLSNTDKATALKLSTLSKSSIDEFGVVLFLEVEELNLKNCDTNDCNDKGSRMDFDVKALLVRKGVLDKINSGAGRPVNTLPAVALKRYNVPVKNLSTSSAVLQAFADITDDTTIDKIDVGLNAAFVNYNYLFEVGAQNPFVGVASALKTMRQKILAQVPVLIQYFYDHLDDLIKAYNEFRKKIIYLNSECCMDEMRFPLHIILGEVTVDTEPGRRSAYREYFIYSPLFDGQKERLSEIRLLFKRIKLLLKKFNPDNPGQFEKREIKITPCEYGKYLLSEGCIPYYYTVDGADNDSKLFFNWNYEKTSRGEEKTNLSYKASEYADAGNNMVLDPLRYDIEEYNFLRVEGHIGKQVGVALPGVLKIKQNYNLPMEVIALNADSVGAILKGEEPKCMIQDLEADYRILIAEFICKLHDAFCNIYKFEFNPKPLTALASSALTLRTVSSAPASGASGAFAGFIAPTEEDDEVAELLSKTNFVALKAEHPILSDLVSEAHLTKTYVKGSSIQKLCGVRKGTVGEIYLSNISRGSFVNPILISNPVIKNATLYQRFLELIDSIESMFQVLLTNELGELDLVAFRKAYNRYEKEVNDLSRQLKTITDKVSVFLSTCILEKLEAMKGEYLRRLNQYKLARHFNYFFKKHGGVEHKAGVTTGGTFILVYHEEIKGRKMDVKSLFVNRDFGKFMLTRNPDILEMGKDDSDEITALSKDLEVAAEFNDPEEYLFFNDAVKKYLKSDPAIPAETKEALLASIGRPPEKPKFKLTNGMVIADFYVPYICCSDCAPVAYVLTEHPSEKTVFDIQPNRFLFDDAHNYPFTTDPPVTNAGTVQKNFSSADLQNPQNLKLLTDKKNLLYLHPAMDIQNTLQATLTYKGIELPITIVKPDASFTANVKVDPGNTDSFMGLVVELVAKSQDADSGGYQWTVISVGGPVLKTDDNKFLKVASPPPVSMDLLLESVETSNILIELTITYTINDNKSTDTHSVTLIKGEVGSFTSTHEGD